VTQLAPSARPSVLDPYQDILRLIDAGEFAAARQEITARLDRSSTDAGAIWCAALVLSRQGDHQHAVQAYKKAVGLDGAYSFVQIPLPWGGEITIMDGGGSSWAADCYREMVADIYGLRHLDLRPGEIVVDVGAHLGTISIALARLYPGVRIIAIEPTTANFTRMQANIARNQVTGITPLQVAVGPRDEPVEMLWTPHDSAAANAKTGAERRELLLRHGWSSEIVPGRQLDGIFAEYGIQSCRFLKLDCEGAEWDIFAASECLNRVESISLELHVHDRHEPVGGEAMRARFLAQLDRLTTRPRVAVASQVWLRL